MLEKRVSCESARLLGFVTWMLKLTSGSDDLLQSTTGVLLIPNLLSWCPCQATNQIKNQTQTNSGVPLDVLFHSCSYMPGL